MSVLDVLKLLFSKDARDTVGTVLARLRASPEWKKDLVLVTEKFTKDQQNQVFVLFSYLEKLLASKGWDAEDIMKVRFGCHELVMNAFEHGLQGAARGSVTVQIQASAQFLQMNITDPGSGFDLKEELRRQGAEDPSSDRCRALALIYRQASELSQSPGKKNRIKVVLRKEHKPCLIEQEGSVLVFRFQGETQPSGYFWAHVVQQIQDLPKASKVVLDFSEVDDMSTRLVSEIVGLLTKHHLLHPPGEEDFSAEQVLSELRPTERAVVSGIQAVNEILREFLRKRFRVFDNVSDALEYFGNQSARQ